MNFTKLSMLALLMGEAFLISPRAFAQDTPEPRINQLIVYGDDPCPQSKADEITVCGRMDEAERYRIPKTLRDDPNDIRKESWTNRVKSYENISDTGIMSCSAVGAGGFTGCGAKAIDAAYLEKSKDPGLAFGQMIAAERKKRLLGIDVEAEAVEARVKAFEADRAAREAKEAEARKRLEEEEDAANEALPQPK